MSILRICVSDAGCSVRNSLCDTLPTASAAVSRHELYARGTGPVRDAISDQPRIKTLEEQLGQPLFRRVNRTLQLTPAGEELYRVAEETLTELEPRSSVLRKRARLWRSPQRPGLHRYGWHLG